MHHLCTTLSRGPGPSSGSLSASASLRLLDSWRECSSASSLFRPSLYFEATLPSQKLLSLQLLNSSKLINKNMIIFSIPMISLAGGRVYHNYCFINVEIKLLIIIILVTNMYHLSLQSKVSWKIQSLHISLEGGLICFSLTSSSQPLSFANIILCRLDQVLCHRFVQQSNTHENVSLIIPQHSYLER